MMAGIGSWIGVVAMAVVDWLLTYAVHSTVLLGGAALLTGRLVRAEAWRDTIWKAALVGGVVTATLQSAAGYRPLAGEWRMPGGTLATEAAARPSSPALAGRQSDAVPDAAGAARSSAVDPGATGSTGATAVAGDGASGERSPAEGRARDAVVPVDRGAPVLFGDETPAWLFALLALWSAGSALLLARLAGRHVRLLRLLRDRDQVTDGAALSLLAALRRNAGVWRPVRLTSSAACPTPLALGTSEICVPERFLRNLDAEQQRSALAHELAHLARRDPAWHLAAGIFESVFFFQPLNRLARLRLREAAENLCDDWAVHQTGSAIGLARCLAEVASWVGRGAASVPSGTMAMVEGGSPLLRRVERLLSDRHDVAARGARVRTAAAVGLLGLVAATAPAVSATGRARPGSTPMQAVETADARGEAAGARSPAPPTWGRAQESVIRYPSPGDPLEQRWAWSEAEARRRGHERYWVAYAFERMLRADRRYVEDSGSWSTDEFGGPPLGRLVFGPDYALPSKGSGPVRQPVLVLFHVTASGGPRVDRISVRTATVGMFLGGDPLYWLGPTPSAESFDWLRGRVDDLDGTRLRGTVIEAMAMHEDAARVLAFLEDVVRSDRPVDLREEAVEGLAWHPLEPAVNLLRTTALEDRSMRIREEAAETLGELDTPEASAALAQIVRSRTPDRVRGEAVEAMASRPVPEVLETLTTVAMEDADPDIQEEAVETIAEFPAASAVPVLEQIATSDADVRIRREAVESLGELDPSAAAQVLEALLRSDAPPELREEAIDAIAARPSPRALETIVRVAFEDPDPDLQEEAVEKLAEFAPADGLPQLRRIIREHPSLRIRGEAVEALGEFPADVALPILDEIVAQQSDGVLLQEAVETIADLPSELSVPRLLRILREHPREEARREALDQLGDRIG